MIENYQHAEPKQDAGENVVISSAPNAKLNNNGHRGGATTLNREEMGDNLGNAKIVNKSLKVRKRECSNASTVETDSATNA